MVHHILEDGMVIKKKEVHFGYIRQHITLIYLIGTSFDPEEVFAYGSLEHYGSNGKFRGKIVEIVNSLKNAIIISI